jgi:alcohol dehydrogenase
MRALVLSRYGGSECTALAEVPPPSPRAGEILVRVRAAGLNPVDYKTRAGALKVVRSYPLPAVMGNEFAGVVESIGPDVERFAKGDRVFARTDKDAMGAFADYAVVHQDHAARMPASLDFVSAAAVPLAALTALQALRDELHLGAGQRVFIPGGAGGVGTFAIQIARQLGAIIATTASPRGEALVKRLGADVVIDYAGALRGKTVRLRLRLRSDRWRDAVAPLVCRETGRTGRLDRRHAGAGNGAKRSRARDWPRHAVLVREPHDASTRRPLGSNYRYLFMHPSGADLSHLASLIDAKALEVVIDRIFPFAEAKEPIAYLEAGHAKGKVVLAMD